jgi:hypothetical protein
VDIAADHGIGGGYVTRVLEQAARFRGYPKAVRTAGGPEFTSRAFLGFDAAARARTAGSGQADGSTAQGGLADLTLPACRRRVPPCRTAGAGGIAAS